MANMTRETIIDCDIHCTVPSVRALFPYLSDYWIETIEQARPKGQPTTTIRAVRPSPPAGTAPESGPGGLGSRTGAKPGTR